MNNNFYFRELSKSLVGMLGIFFISMLIIAYFAAASLTGKFLTSLDNDIVLITSDFCKLQLSYSNRIKYVKSDLEQLEINPQELNKYFNSDKTLILDRSNIGAIIVSDNAQKIIYSDASTEPNKTILLPNRSYLDKLKSTPDKIVFGDIVTGILTKRPSIPIATKLKSKDNKFEGYLIFSINLKNLSLRLVKNSLSGILIQDSPNIEYENNYELLKDSPLRFFLNHILFGTETILFTAHENFTGKFLELQYNTRNIKMELYALLITSSCIVFCILLVVLLFYYYRILRPLRPALNFINNITDIQKFNDNNLFSFINTALSEQSKAISFHENAYREQVFKLISLTSTASAINYYIKNTLEELLENIHDIKSNARIRLHKRQRIVFEELENAVVNSEQDIKSLLSNFVKIAELIKIHDKQDIDIVSLLAELNVNSSIVDHTVSDIKLTLNKTLFRVLLEEIVSLQNNDLNLYKINLENNALNFIFTQSYDTILNGNGEKFIIFKIWGILNNIRVGVMSRKGHFIISCIFY